ncbi:ubiquinone biosynthesis protein UbiA [Chitinophaga alhagiae]|uniref:Ubiquinone biosynthesis protein UbiA n=1 Tax=Chitinophaga alhagiae TaxID=2203219 RepID=A0ABM6W946_9BACT|nr:geranylgeranylglycerol-phosphate geranylgeranyltransferase [Chitinophaga alhagiae]AWO00460.1 ubiquinone biosynthesis protein UbiA [Chitinophaga alhagiae]
MTLLAAFFRMVRYPNLIYIALTQFLLQYCVVAPVLQNSGAEPSLSFPHFLMLCFSTVLVAAGGYIINDYFDINIDLVNKPEKMVVEKIINRRWAMAWHTILNMAGVSLGFLVAFQIGQFYLGFVQVFCTLLLWFYSTSFKRQVLIGNVAISLLTALSVVVVGFYERQIYESFEAIMSATGRKLIKIIGIYALFAFVLSMVREIVKDMEDMIGDSKDGCRTIPIVWGLKKAKAFTMLLMVILQALLVIIMVVTAFKTWYAAAGYILLFVLLPFTLFVQKPFLQAYQPAHFHKISTWIKIVMLTGILSMVFFKIML